MYDNVSEHRKAVGEDMKILMQEMEKLDLQQVKLFKQTLSDQEIRFLVTNIEVADCTQFNQIKSTREPAICLKKNYN